MDASVLRKRFEQSKLSEHVSYFERLVRPAIDVEVFDSDIVLGASKLGGAPDLPEDSRWPVSEHGPYRFLAQIDCRDLPDVGAGLPTAGLLSLFVGESADGEFFWQDPGFVRAELIPDGTRLVSMPAPEAVARGEARTIRFRAAIDIPQDEEQASDWPFDDMNYEFGEEYTRIRKSLHLGTHYLLGYPSHCSLAYDPTPGPAWTSLLNLASDDELNWDWHDGDYLMAFIERDRLARGDFSNVASDAG